MHTYIYCRISSDPTGRKAGVERQQHTCEQYAQQHDLTPITEVFTDNDISAYHKHRPAYQQLRDRLQQHPGSRVIVWHSDRLYRTSRDLEPWLTLAQETRTTLYAVNGGGEVDLTTASGRMNARILVDVATHEIEHTSERVKLSKARLREQGRWSGGRYPLGYMRNPDPNPDSPRIIPDPERAPIVQEATRRVLRGDTIMGLTNTLTTRTPSGAKIRAVTIRNALRAPTIAGLITHQGEVVGTGNWEPLISLDDWHALQDELDRRRGDDKGNSKHQGRTRNWQGAGVYRCGKCGSPLRTGPNGKKRKDGDDPKRTATYVCMECHKTRRQAGPLDDYISTIICAYLARERVQPQQHDDDTQHIERLHAERRRLTHKRDRLTSLFIDDTITEIELAQSKREIAERIDTIDHELARHRTSNPLAALTTADDMRAHWDQMPADNRATIIDTLATVTLIKSPPGPKFRPESVQIEWK